MLMRTDHTPIDAMDVPIQLACGIRLLLQGLEHLLPEADSAPVVKSPRNRLPGALATG